MGTLERTEKARKILLQEYFSSTSRVPELEGFLHLKDGYKRSWKKVYFILRASGLYYSNKGKNKVLHMLSRRGWGCGGHMESLQGGVLYVCLCVSVQTILCVEVWVIITIARAKHNSTGKAQ